MSSEHKNLISPQALKLFATYPCEIEEHLYELFNSILNSLNINNIVSILFIGSASRGELSFQFGEKGIDIYSDYEFVIVVKKILKKQDYDSLNNLFRRLEKKWLIKSPLFQIDYGVSTLFKFKHTPPTLWSYEAKNLGVIIYGSDVRGNLATVKINNLDFGNLNELIIIRLWNMLIHINNGFLKKENNEYENFIIKFYYSRNILDILTILLPNYGILKDGYQNRIEYFSNSFNEPRWNKYKIDIIKASNLKLNLIDDISLSESQTAFNHGFVELLFDIANLGDNTSIQKLEDSKYIFLKNKIFTEKIMRKMRRKFLEFKIFQNYYKFNPNSIKFFFNDGLRFDLLLLLIFMHKSIDLQELPEDKVEYLKTAIHYFNKISFHNKFNFNSEACLEDNFIMLREKLLDFMMIWHYGRSNTKKSDIEKLFNWRE
jgi:hypothetical protein